MVKNQDEKLSCYTQRINFLLQTEINKADKALANRQPAQSWHYLERAHMLGQAYSIEHAITHWKMLQFGFYIKSCPEIRGQQLRLVFGGVKSFVGKVPTANTGGANVHPRQSMEIAEDLLIILHQNRKT